ncbi:MAG TPA: GNAT family N-acetyltransferase [Vicinamibacteria bacterium]|nr:GNAT family N-acetyltransferase [Vicinamibacteria bacterium]
MRIREATSHQDLDEVTRIEREVWNVADIDIAGRIQLRASQHAGGSVLIAETEDGVVAGFAYAFPAFEHGEVFWHSDMLAVRPAFRGGKVGQALKWAQREAALGKGIRRITWTFDPMQAGNAHLNLELLGATAREYLSDFYGVTSSDLHHGLPTDRLLASWDLESPRVVAVARGEKPAAAKADLTVPIPAAWNELVRREPARAREEQRRVERELRAAFSTGLAATGFDKAGAAYVLTRERP